MVAEVLGRESSFLAQLRNLLINMSGFCFLFHDCETVFIPYSRHLQHWPKPSVIMILSTISAYLANECSNLLYPIIIGLCPLWVEHRRLWRILREHRETIFTVGVIWENLPWLSWAISEGSLENWFCLFKREPSEVLNHVTLPTRDHNDAK